MRTSWYKFFLFSFLAFTTWQDLLAQKNELGGSLGILNYRGDISPSFNFAYSRPAGNLFYRRNFNPYVSLRIAATFGLIGADETNSSLPIAKVRKASFTGFLTEAALQFEYNFFNYIVNYRERGNVNKFTPYLTGGLAYAYPQINPAIDDQKVITKGIVAIPIGIGIKYMLGQQWNLGAEAVARKTFTDRFDGISDFKLEDKLLGDPINNDYYYYIGVTISYTFYKIHCPSKR